MNSTDTSYHVYIIFLILMFISYFVLSFWSWKKDFLKEKKKYLENILFTAQMVVLLIVCYYFFPEPAFGLWFIVAAIILGIIMIIVSKKRL